MFTAIPVPLFVRQVVGFYENAAVDVHPGAPFGRRRALGGSDGVRVSDGAILASPCESNEGPEGSGRCTRLPEHKVRLANDIDKPIQPLYYPADRSNPMRPKRGILMPSFRTARERLEIT